MTDTTLITSTGIVAIVRGDHMAHIGELADALFGGGVRAVEVTLNSPNALEMIAALSRKWSGRMLIGAGTVLNVLQLDAAAGAGAAFCVSPDTFAPVVERAFELGIEPIPGAFTPTEIRTAVRAGARFVKLFPAMPSGPDYFSQIRAPLDNVMFIPTGGIDETNFAAFIRAGAVACGIGSSLVPKRLDGSDDQLRRIQDAARRLISLFAASFAGNG